MNTYRNKITGIILEISSEFGNNKVWERISPTPAEKVKAEPKEEKKEETPKKAVTRKAVKK